MSLRKNKLTIKSEYDAVLDAISDKDTLNQSNNTVLIRAIADDNDPEAFAKLDFVTDLRHGKGDPTMPVFPEETPYCKSVEIDEAELRANKKMKA